MGNELDGKTMTMTGETIYSDKLHELPQSEQDYIMMYGVEGWLSQLENTKFGRHLMGMN
jgi:hypothetical protein